MTRLYLAPMEEVTGYVYRNVYHRLFGEIDCYFTPFLAPPRKNGFRKKEEKEIDPANNQGMNLVPQVMTNRPEQLYDCARVLSGYGYRTMNLNLGCPSATVVPKRKGSGFLRDPEELEAFFDEYFQKMSEAGAPPVELSVKTRLGLTDPGEFEAILAVYNRFPISEVIIHARVQTDFYRNQPNLEQFERALKDSVHPVCYNGDIFTAGDYETLMTRFPSLEAVMLGRGLVANPGLARQIRTGQKITKEELSLYAGALYEGYVQAYGQENNALHKMKEVWFYLGTMFQGAEKSLKKIRKADTAAKYLAAVDELFAVCPLAQEKIS